MPLESRFLPNDQGENENKLTFFSKHELLSFKTQEGDIKTFPQAICFLTSHFYKFKNVNCVI